MSRQIRKYILMSSLLLLIISIGGSFTTASDHLGYIFNADAYVAVPILFIICLMYYLASFGWGTKLNLYITSIGTLLLSLVTASLFYLLITTGDGFPWGLGMLAVISLGLLLVAIVLFFISLVIWRKSRSKVNPNSSDQSSVL